MKPIEPTDDVRQDSDGDPTGEDMTAGYLVFSADGDSRYFEHFDDAQNFASRQRGNTDSEVWSVFPLYAAEPITITG